MNDRRLNLCRLMAALMLGAALWGLFVGRESSGEAELPRLREGRARARLDGGQMMGLAEGVRPNELSCLNLGRKIDFQTARPDLLSRLPGLGRASVASGRERGYLTDYQRRGAEGLLLPQNSKNQAGTDDEPQSAPDNL